MVLTAARIVIKGQGTCSTCIYSSGQFLISTMPFNIVPFLVRAVGPYPYCLVQWSLLMIAVWYLICLVCWLWRCYCVPFSVSCSSCVKDKLDKLYL